MPAIGDSDAFRDDRRVLTQHHAAITLIQPRLTSPARSRLRWLDLACGRGQIIGSFREAFSDEVRARIDYVAYDIDQHFVRETAKAAEALRLGSVEGVVGDLAVLDSIMPPDWVLDYITFTNTAHEIVPITLVHAILGAFSRLSNAGLFYAYDMETLDKPELGAISWTREEIDRIVQATLKALGSTYQPEASRVPHTTTSGWSIVVEAAHIGVDRDEIRERRQYVIGILRREIDSVLRSRLGRCSSALQSLTISGVSTAEEESIKLKYLYEFWALTRSLEASE